MDVRAGRARAHLGAGDAGVPRRGRLADVSEHPEPHRSPRAEHDTGPVPPRLCDVLQVRWHDEPPLPANGLQSLETRAKRQLHLWM